MKVLITGGNGYVGKAVSQALSRNFDITVLDKGSTISTSSEYEFISIDITDRESLSTLFQGNKFDVVIHLAALKSISESLQVPDLYESVNEIGTANLFETWNESIKNGLFIFASSAAVYGNLDLGRPIREDDRCSPDNPYGNTKLNTEWYLTRLAAMSGKRISILRFFNVAGSYDGEVMEVSPSNLIPIIVSRGLNNQALTIYGSDFATTDGTPSRDYIHVLDVADAIEDLILATENSNEWGVIQTFNLCSGFSFTVKQIFDLINETFGLTMEAHYSPRREGEVGIITGDNSKIESVIGWTPKRTINDIINSYEKYFLD